METDERIARSAIQYYEQSIPNIPKRPERPEIVFRGEPQFPIKGDIFEWNAFAESLNNR